MQKYYTRTAYTGWLVRDFVVARGARQKSQTPMLSLTLGCCSSPFFPASSSAALSEVARAHLEWILLATLPALYLLCMSRGPAPCRPLAMRYSALSARGRGSSRPQIALARRRHRLAPEQRFNLGLHRDAVLRGGRPSPRGTSGTTRPAPSEEGHDALGPPGRAVQERPGSEERVVGLQHPGKRRNTSLGGRAEQGDVHALLLDEVRVERGPVPVPDGEEVAGGGEGFVLERFSRRRHHVVQVLVRGGGGPQVDAHASRGS